MYPCSELSVRQNTLIQQAYNVSYSQPLPAFRFCARVSGSNRYTKFNDTAFRFLRIPAEFSTKIVIEDRQNGLRKTLLTSRLAQPDCMISCTGLRKTSGRRTQEPSDINNEVHVTLIQRLSKALLRDRIGVKVRIRNCGRTYLFAMSGCLADMVIRRNESRRSPSRAWNLTIETLCGLFRTEPFTIPSLKLTEASHSRFRTSPPCSHHLVRVDDEGRNV